MYEIVISILGCIIQIELGILFFIAYVVLNKDHKWTPVEP